PKLVLANGHTYTEVTFKRLEPDAVTVAHADGIARIPMERLQVEAQNALGYDPIAAEAFRLKFEADKKALDAANKKRTRLARAARKKRTAEQDRQRLIKSGTFHEFKILQVLKKEGGYLAARHTPAHPR